MENLNEENKGILVTPIKDFNWQYFPIVEDKQYRITNEEMDKLDKHELKWHYEEETIDGKTITHCSLVPNDNTHELQVASARQEKQEILKWLADNDWKVNKIVLGEWLEDDPRVVEYKRERKEKRERLDYLEILLREGTNNK